MNEQSTSTSHFSVYESVTKKIIESIQRGADLFFMPWHGGSPPNLIPVNAVSHSPYRGINILVLWAEAFAKRYPSGNWASYRQWKSLGAQVRDGEHATVVVFFKVLEPPVESPEGEVSKTKRFVARAFRVFNAAQVDGWDEPPLPQVPVYFGIKDADAFVAATKAQIRHGGVQARYLLKEDIIEIPEWKTFRGSATSSSLESYYAVLLHELTHWSGAPHRMNRSLGQRFGDEAYAMEELIAELGAAFLCAALGIANDPRPDHAAYVASWLKVLNDDHAAIFTAAAHAQRAIEYLARLAKSNHWGEKAPATNGES